MRGWKILACAIALGALAGCSTIQDMMGVEPKSLAVAQAPVVNSDTFCLIAQPIAWSSKDTPETIEAVKEHNAIGVRLCHWQGHTIIPKPQP